MIEAAKAMLSVPVVPIPSVPAIGNQGPFSMPLPPGSLQFAIFSCAIY